MKNLIEKTAIIVSIVPGLMMAIGIVLNIPTLGGYGFVALVLSVPVLFVLMVVDTGVQS